tara:strand:- start:1316 stop:1861 length:546 start_codon:yes stop_codon:yes gene_type:complete
MHAIAITPPGWEAALHIFGLTGAGFAHNRTDQTQGKMPIKPHPRGTSMASSDRGTKRTDPETGKKFYDLNLDPVVSPYTGKSYPRSYFEQAAIVAKAAPVKAKPVKSEEDEIEDEIDDVAAPEIVSLEEADAEESGDEDIPDTDDVEVDEDLGDDDADTFLEEDEDDEDELGFDVNTDDEP